MNTPNPPPEPPGETPPWECPDCGALNAGPEPLCACGAVRPPVPHVGPPDR